MPQKTRDLPRQSFASYDYTLVWELKGYVGIRLPQAVGLLLCDHGQLTAFSEPGHLGAKSLGVSAQHLARTCSLKELPISLPWARC